MEAILFTSASVPSSAKGFFGIGLPNASSLKADAGVRVLLACRERVERRVR
jgi:hypothetical protein